MDGVEKGGWRLAAVGVIAASMISQKGKRLDRKIRDRKMGERAEARGRKVAGKLMAGKFNREERRAVSNRRGEKESGRSVATREHSSAGLQPKRQNHKGWGGSNHGWTRMNTDGARGLNGLKS